VSIREGESPFLGVSVMDKKEVLQAIRGRIYGSLKFLRREQETDYSTREFVTGMPFEDVENMDSGVNREWTEGFRIVLGNRSLTRIERDEL